MVIAVIWSSITKHKYGYGYGIIGGFVCEIMLLLAINVRLHYDKWRYWLCDYLESHLGVTIRIGGRLLFLGCPYTMNACLNKQQMANEFVRN
jgi:hypothetical protein